MFFYIRSNFLKPTFQGKLSLFLFLMLLLQSPNVQGLSKLLSSSNMGKNSLYISSCFSTVLINPCWAIMHQLLMLPILLQVVPLHQKRNTCVNLPVSFTIPNPIVNFCATNHLCIKLIYCIHFLLHQLIQNLVLLLL